ncbi:glycosyltransferase [Flavobacteriaceae bacterium R38]|nr:glycosyltransferase [Flavobacteriaceae bacterium R38]
MLILLLYIYIAVVVIQLLFFLLIFRTFAFHKEMQSSIPDSFPPVSVIICAKNEAQNLKDNLPSVLNQEYPEFQIILINDASSDNTLEVMKAFAKGDSRIKIVDVENAEAFWGNKKYALTLGIKASKYNHLLFTDADCHTNSNLWIQEMAKKFTRKETIILGYGPYKKIKKSFLNALIRFETLITAIQYFSYARIGIPYMGVGRNLAYHKSEFFNNKGYINHMNIKSGDDDLFIKEVAKKDNVAINYSFNSIVYSNPKESFKDWFLQKRRHISTATHYKFYHKFLLGIFYLSSFLFWSLFIFLLIIKFNWITVISLALLRILIQYIIFVKSFRKLHENSLSLYIPLLELSLIVFQFAIFIVNSISKPTYWK